MFILAIWLDSKEIVGRAISRQPSALSKQARSSAELTATPPTAERCPSQQSGEILGEVGEDDIRAGAPNGSEGLQDHALAVHPAQPGGGGDERELAAHLIGGDGYVELAARQGDDVKVRQGGFHHDDVRALLNVERDLAHRLALVGRIHLVGLAVAEL